MSLAPAELEQRIDRLNRVRLAALPTPLQEFPRLAREIGAERLLVKRDDLTGLGLGGNKIRGLEFLLGQALAEGADTFVAGGGVAQSNHARQCAAAARRLGMDVHLVLRRGLVGEEITGNRLVTGLYQPTIHWVDSDPGLDNREGLAPVMDEVAAELEAEGRKPWVLHSSVHPLTSMGYVVAGLELAAQLDSAGIEKATVVCTSMGATRIGLGLSAQALSRDWQVVAGAWRPLFDGLGAVLTKLASESARLLELSWAPTPADLETIDSGGPHYGIPSNAGMQALHLAAEVEALLLDPVYTAKGFAGLIQALKDGRIPREVAIVFVHTGGLPALFAYDLEVPAEGADIRGRNPKEYS